ncbi:DUF6116 family protein [Microbulbifer litoralis]|uniref:DUF6116 family protein n=1 Tax=Microbulbifer litoralis TaxID=2933965 RepID=UPI00202790E4|nr:DUF6116 family protein [Microbulbifer sp. GX H0434]
MKRVLPSALVSWFLSYAGKLEHPGLFKWITAIFLVNLFIPDPIIFLDELLLGLLALYLGRQKKDRHPQPATEKNVGRGKGEKVRENRTPGSK